MSRLVVCADDLPENRASNAWVLVVLAARQVQHDEPRQHASAAATGALHVFALWLRLERKHGVLPAIRRGANASLPAKGERGRSGCGFIVLGTMGACFSVFGFSGSDPSYWLNPFSFVGAALVAGALFLLWLVRGGR